MKKTQRKPRQPQQRQKSKLSRRYFGGDPSDPHIEDLTGISYDDPDFRNTIFKFARENLDEDGKSIKKTLKINVLDDIKYVNKYLRINKDLISSSDIDEDYLTKCKKYINDEILKTINEHENNVNAKPIDIPDE